MSADDMLRKATPEQLRRMAVTVRERAATWERWAERERELADRYEAAAIEKSEAER